MKSVNRRVLASSPPEKGQTMMSKGTASIDRWFACWVLASVAGLWGSAAPGFGDEETSASMSPAYAEQFATSEYQLRVMHGDLNGLTEEQKAPLFINRSPFDVELRSPSGTIRQNVAPGSLVMLDATPARELVVQVSLESGDLKHTVLVQPGQVIYLEEPGVPYHIVAELATGPPPASVKHLKNAERLKNEDEKSEDN